VGRLSGANVQRERLGEGGLRGGWLDSDSSKCHGGEQSRGGRIQAKRGGEDHEESFWLAWTREINVGTPTP